MSRDRWCALGIAGALVSCLACLAPVAAAALGALGLFAWTGHRDAVLLAMVAGFVVLIAYRDWIRGRWTP